MLSFTLSQFHCNLNNRTQNAQYYSLVIIRSL